MRPNPINQNSHMEIYICMHTRWRYQIQLRSPYTCNIYIYTCNIKSKEVLLQDLSSFILFYPCVYYTIVIMWTKYAPKINEFSSNVVQLFNIQKCVFGISASHAEWINHLSTYRGDVLPACLSRVTCTYCHLFFRARSRNTLLGPQNTKRRFGAKT